MKNKLLIIFIVTGIIIFIGSILFNKISFKNNIQKNQKATKTKLIDNKEIKLTKEQQELYYKIYRDPYVLHIRKALNGYLNGTNEGIQLSVAIESTKSGGEIYGLDSFSKDYYRSKFIVLNMENNLWGGRQIYIIFQDKPDRVFRVWVYGHDETSYDLRSFAQDKSFNKEEIEGIQKQYKFFLKDKIHSL